MATKLDRLVTCHEGRQSITSLHPLVTWSCEITWQTKNIFTTTLPMATKLSRIMTYLKWFLPVKSHDCIVTWSCKITWQTKIVIYSLAQCLWLSILSRGDIPGADPDLNSTSAKLCYKKFRLTSFLNIHSLRSPIDVPFPKIFHLEHS